MFYKAIKKEISYIQIFDKETPVLIAGGSLVGLSMSLFLSWHGIPSILIEKHSSTSIHPRASGYNLRSMEIFRSIGLEEDIQKVGLAEEYKTGNILAVERLAGKEYGWFNPPYHQGASQNLEEITPVKGWGVCAQDVLEPILKNHAQKLGADLQYNTELIAFEKDKEKEGLVVWIKDRSTGVIKTIKTQYLVAADGANSFVRSVLNIPLKGPGTIANLIGIYFCGDLDAVLKERRFAICHISNSDVNGALAVYDNNRYVLSAMYNPENGQTPEDFTEERCIDILKSAIGLPELNVKIKSVLPWQLAGFVAERFQDDGNKIFLVGDSAHVIPPTGAFGANTGIQDAHNLAWKLALVVKGISSSKLLSTYDLERRPIAAFTMQQTLLRSEDRKQISVSASFSSTSRIESKSIGNYSDYKQQSIVDDLALMLGYRYPCSYKKENIEAFKGEITDLYEDPHNPSGSPGTRAPHIILLDPAESKRISTLDLFGKNFVLFAHTDYKAKLIEEVKSISSNVGVKIDVYNIGYDESADYIDVSHKFNLKYGISHGGAALVRPDGFIAWKSKSTDKNHNQNFKSYFKSIVIKV
jgi:putative polyketide hydroxylase